MRRSQRLEGEGGAAAPGEGGGGRRSRGGSDADPEWAHLDQLFYWVRFGLGDPAAERRKEGLWREFGGELATLLRHARRWLRRVQRRPRDQATGDKGGDSDSAADGDGDTDSPPEHVGCSSQESGDDDM